jgi:flagellar hook assembly protein FlgD
MQDEPASSSARCHARREKFAIAFSLARPVGTHLAIYDVTGKLVRVLVNERRPAGDYRVEWDGRDRRGTPTASGVYFYRLEAEEFTATHKMVMLR